MCLYYGVRRRWSKSWIVIYEHKSFSDFRNIQICSVSYSDVNKAISKEIIDFFFINQTDFITYSVDTHFSVDAPFIY